MSIDDVSIVGSKGEILPKKKIREISHTDILDCLIAATAWKFEGVLVSEDELLEKSIQKLNPEDHIEIINWNTFRNLHRLIQYQINENYHFLNQ